MTALTTTAVGQTMTQRYGDQHQMVVGTLTHFTIEVKNPADARFKHQARMGDATLGTDSLVAGVEYTVKTVVDADKNKDWSVIGHINATQAGFNGNASEFSRTVTAGQKFIASGKNASGTQAVPGEDIPVTGLTSVVSYGSTESITRLAIAPLQQVVSVIAIGKWDNTNFKFNILVENAGHTEINQPLDATGSRLGTANEYPGVTKERILYILNKSYNNAAVGNETTFFDVDYMDF